MMRILMLVPDFPVDTNRIKGGVHSAVINLLRGFAGKDIQVRLLTLNNEVAKDTVVRLNEQVDIKYCNYGSIPSKALSYLVRGSGILKRNIEEYNPDIVHYQIGGFFLFTTLGGYLGRKSVLTVHGIPSHEARIQPTLKGKLTYYLYAWVNDRLAPFHTICISKYSKALMGQDRMDQFPIIYNAVNEKFFAIPPRQEHANRLLYVGVINDRKNILLLLEALADLTGQGKVFQLDVIGGFAKNDPYELKVKKFIADNNLERVVKLHGWKPQDELPGFLADADIFILPSKQETLPVAIEEAMAASRCVIASAVGGVPEMVEDGVSGFLFESGSKDALVSVLEKVYNNDALLDRVGKAAHEQAIAKYAPTTVAEQTIGYYKQVLSSR
ncbi:glycosyltransferase family 4 protein [Flavihumibacter rivuli]|uniref:glycosyltransferase family 4 protein n=1 Tax=Flavihumibacter rivuli TaxID=2838156 RepID=UPI001BDF3C2A|nr:glycosyltransferase family 4 protein [Flavihumibacter rivuli]ULQ57946.1 glycosyltransferase family 4 protein [Flavihumibacter rivuli]